MNEEHAGRPRELHGSITGEGVGCKSDCFPQTSLFVEQPQHTEPTAASLPGERGHLNLGIRTGTPRAGGEEHRTHNSSTLSDFQPPLPLALFNPLKYIKTWKQEPLQPKRKGPYQVLLTKYASLKVAGLPAWIHHRPVKAAPLDQCTVTSGELLKIKIRWTQPALRFRT